MPSESKSDLRVRLLRLRASLPAETRAAADAAIRAHVLQCEPVVAATAIAAYAAIGAEVATQGILDEVCARVGWIALPVSLDDGTPAFVRCDDPARLATGPDGILAPPKPWVQVDAAKLECVLVPGVAFDRSGGRLGRGGGFYDRLLPQVHCPTVGVAYELQVVDNAQLERHDIAMQALVTETGFRKMTHRV